MKIEEKYYTHTPYTSPLKRQLWKKFDERLAKLILSYYDDKYDALQCLDQPDLQIIDKSLAIEVVNVKSKIEGFIDGNFANYTDPKASDKKKNVSIKNLNKIGIQMQFPGVITKPSITDKNRIEHIVCAYKTKIDKLDKYKEYGFNKIGLFLIDENPLINPLFENISTTLKHEFTSKDYDIIFYNAANTLILFDSDKNVIDNIKIPNKDFNAINYKARDIVEHLEITKKNIAR